MNEQETHLLVGALAALLAALAGEVRHRTTVRKMRRQNRFLTRMCDLDDSLSCPLKDTGECPMYDALPKKPQSTRK